MLLLPLEYFIFINQYAGCLFLVAMYELSAKLFVLNTITMYLIWRESYDFCKQYFLLFV